MELVPCPKCGEFNDASAAACAQCHSPMDAAPVAAAPTPIALRPLEEAAPPPPAEEAALEPPPAFEPPPEVQARIDRIESDIAARPTAPGGYVQLSKVYAEAGRKDLAVEALDRLLAIDPANAFARHKRSQLTGVPETAVATGTVAPSPAAVGGVARPGAGAPRGGQTVSFQAGVAQRPAAPRVENLMQRMTGRTRAIIGGSVAVVLLAVAVKVFLFPGTRVLVTGDLRAFAPSWSPNGKYLGFILDDGHSPRLAVYDFKAGSYRALVPAASWDARGIAWSPDGTRIAYTAMGAEDGGEAVHVVDVASGQSRRLAAGSGPLWTAGGDSVVMTCGPERSAAMEEESEMDWTPRLCTVDAFSGAVKRGAPAEYGMSVSPLVLKALSEKYAEAPEAAASRPAGASGDGEFQDMTQSLAESGARNFAQGSRNLSRELRARQYTERKKAGRDAARLPYGADVVVTDIASGNAVQVTSDGQAAYASWTPDGSRILYATNGSSGIEMWTMNPDGGDRRMVVPGSVRIADPSAVTLSQDGRDVFFIAPVPGDPALARLMTGESPADLHVLRVGEKTARRLDNRHPFKQRFAVSPDGTRIAYEVLQDVKMLGGAQRSEIWLMKR
jgi:Tol biopolymer transport system component